MKPAPIPHRILTALELAPMTAEQLARCLSLSISATRLRVRELRYARRVWGRSRLTSPNGRPVLVYALREFCQAERDPSTTNSRFTRAPKEARS